MNLSLYDLHCDTAHEIYLKNEGIYSNSCAVSLEKASKYKEYFQTFAIWSNCSLNDDEAFARFGQICEHFNKEALKYFDSKARGFILSLEDARILNNDISRLDYLEDCGIRIITPVWSGVSCIGGAYDTDVGLTEFGIQVIRECFKRNIIPDISHSSRKTAEQIFELNSSGRPIVASHSDSYSVNPHPRNLTDEEFLKIKELSGLVGINLFCEHLGMSCDDQNAICKVLKHIEHYLSLGGEDIICFGCDFDGAQTPNSLSSISDLDLIADSMLRIGYSEDLINKIFWENAKGFINRNFR